MDVKTIIGVFATVFGVALGLLAGLTALANLPAAITQILANDAAPRAFGYAIGVILGCGLFGALSFFLIRLGRRMVRGE
jgi:hypothetical protein